MSNKRATRASGPAVVDADVQRRLGLDAPEGGAKRFRGTTVSQLKDFMFDLLAEDFPTVKVIWPKVFPDFKQRCGSEMPNLYSAIAARNDVICNAGDAGAFFCNELVESSLEHYLRIFVRNSILEAHHVPTFAWLLMANQRFFKSFVYPDERVFRHNDVGLNKIALAWLRAPPEVSPPSIEIMRKLLVPESLLHPDFLDIQDVLEAHIKVQETHYLSLIHI